VWFGLIVMGCASSSRQHLRVPPGRPEDEPARKLYIAKCTKCHGFYDPGSYSDAEWQRWMSKMSKKAKLNPEQAQTLADYLEKTFRTQPASGPTH
jgi:hypothetical protein